MLGMMRPNTTNVVISTFHVSTGFDADIVVWNPTRTWEKDGRLYYGRVTSTYVRGMLVFGGDDGSPVCGRRVVRHR
jgi:dihydroorotase-like cyclic amidohydrolase